MFPMCFNLPSAAQRVRYKWLNEMHAPFIVSNILSKHIYVYVISRFVLICFIDRQYFMWVCKSIFVAIIAFVSGASLLTPFNHKSNRPIDLEDDRRH